MPFSRRAPLPWKVVLGDATTEHTVIAPPAERFPALEFATPMVVARCEELEDAVFIADACNFHERLVDDLKKVLAALEKAGQGKHLDGSLWAEIRAKRTLEELRRDVEESVAACREQARAKRKG